MPGEPRYRRRRPRSSTRRPSAYARGYDGRWRKAARAFLQEHPLCVRHLEKQRLVEATVVDHVRPHRGDYELFWDRSNWQALCKPCHDRKTALEDGGFGR